LKKEFSHREHRDHGERILSSLSSYLSVISVISVAYFPISGQKKMKREEKETWARGIMAAVKLLIVFSLIPGLIKGFMSGRIEAVIKVVALSAGLFLMAKVGTILWVSGKIGSKSEDR